MAIAGVDPNIEQNRKALLEAIARAGSAGEKEYNDAQTQIEGYRQQVIDQAGQGFGGADVAASLQAQSGTAFAGRLADNASARADFSGGLARSQASHENYLTNVSAAQGTLQAVNANKLSVRETQLKAIQAKLDAQAKQEAEDRAYELQMREEDRAFRREEHNWSRQAASAKASASSASSKAAATPKFDQLMGAAQAGLDLRDSSTPSNKLTDSSPQWADLILGATDYSVFSGRSVQEELARAVAEAGFDMTPAEINAVMTPAKMNSYNNATAPPTDTSAESLASKYDNKGVTYDLAKSVLGNVDYQHDVQWIQQGADGKTQGEVEQLLRQYYLVDRYWPSEYEILMGEYVNKLPR